MHSVLHIGLKSVLYSSKGIEKGFKEAGFTEYQFFDWQAVRFDEGILGCRARMLQAARFLMPDLIFLHIQNADIIDHETAISLSECGFVVNYTFDIRSLEQMEWMYELAPLIGLTLFACQEDVDEAKRRGMQNVGHMHSSCDYDQYRPLCLPAHVKGLYPEIIFIGNNYINTDLGFENDQERVDMVDFMRKVFGERFGVIGQGWGPGIHPLNPVDEVNAYNSCHIVVGHNNYIRTSYCSDRVWRSIASQGLILNRYYPGIDEDLDDPMPWETFDDLKETCDFLLDNPGERAEIIHSQHADFLTRHTWVKRIEQMKSMINELSLSKTTNHE